ncbi:hypothetical protein J2Z40_003056 [Cytobacillus eiseniae]|uniref:Uncharacterized protein n=1 Tax=Cytobacillus eiseniae TaxID=762947 RepID=A0ABS4RHV7_9BACI|nr:hypothetical protein [Cytobacillus eiseniae]
MSKNLHVNWNGKNRFAGYKAMGYVTGNEESVTEQMRLF